MGCSLREFKPEDLEAIWELDQECFEPGIAYSHGEMLHYVNRRRAFTLVAEDAGAIAGFIICERAWRKAVGHIITLDIRESHRRRGLASRLMQAAEERLAHDGTKAVYLETAVNNSPAIAFYKRFGYHVLKTVPRYYKGELDAFLMGKELATGGSEWFSS